ncbi:MAG: hypothetical protein IJ485_01480 [Lachnospiraceae bacterium]|nr:hypothetical protein [Lachnospiraceae bacterium]
MRKDDVAVLKEVQKNTQMAMKAIDALSDKIYDDDMAIQIARQSLKYSDIHNRATEKLVDAHAQIYKNSAINDMMLAAGVKMNTLLNTSTSHIAELLIQGSNRGLTHMWKAMNMYPASQSVSIEIAKELMDFEEKNIERLKKFL